jgi:hypothetical protein
VVEDLQLMSHGSLAYHDITIPKDQVHAVLWDDPLVTSRPPVAVPQARCCRCGCWGTGASTLKRRAASGLRLGGAALPRQAHQPQQGARVAAPPTR